MVDDLAGKVLLSIEKVAKESLPSAKLKETKKRKVIPGWNDDVKAVREEASFWYNVWLSADKPIDCELHRIMKRTRNIYHMMIRKCKRAKEEISKNKLLNACVNGEGDLFEEV